MSEAPGSRERAAAAPVRFPPPAGATSPRLSRPRGVRPARRWAGRVGASPGRGGAPCRPRRAERAEGPRAGCHRVRTGAAAAAAGASRGPESEPNAPLAARRAPAPAGAAAAPPARPRSGRARARLGPLLVLPAPHRPSLWSGPGSRSRGGGGGSRSSPGRPGRGCCSPGTRCSPSSPPSCSTPWRR